MNTLGTFYSVNNSFTTDALFSGLGTEASPFEINDFDDLVLLCENDTYWDSHFIQTADIDASITQYIGGPEYTPIGASINPFTGSYDGDGYSINSLNIDIGTSWYGGLFAVTSGAIIQNLHLTDYSLHGSQSIGGIIGLTQWEATSITNCSVDGEIHGTYYVGGIIGQSSSSTNIIDCTVNAILYTIQYGGGLVGKGTADVDNCQCDIEFPHGSYNQFSYLGGLIGWAQGATIDDSSCSLYANAPNVYYIGGLIGWADIGNIVSNCNANVNIINAYARCGGVVGYNNASGFYNCYSVGFVQGSSTIGGFVGYNNGGISNCYSECEVTSTQNLGGFVGRNYGFISNCYSCGLLQGPGSNSKGFCYLNENTINDCYWNTETSGMLTSDGGIGLSISEMRDMITFTDAGWDFVGESTNGDEDIWNIDPDFNNGYPYLNWQEVSYPPDTGEMLISEISDNLNTEDGSTGFIELYNNSPFSVDISGYLIRRGSNGGTFVTDGNQYEIPANTILSSRTRLLIGNGADELAFKTAWGIDDDVFYLAGDSALDIANGYAYQLWNPNVRAQNIDESPNVNANEHIIQQTPGVWSAPDLPENSTPGENSGGQTLPVTLSSFTAVQTDNGSAMIEWITQSEANTAGFNVLRNTVEDELSTVMVNGTLIAGTNTSTEQHYSFTDEEVELDTEYFYWLESVDFSGTVTHFGPVSIKIESEEPGDEIHEIIYTTSLNNLYPNPFNPLTTLSFSLKGDSDVHISVYNIRGEKIEDVVQAPFAGEQTHTVTWDGKSQPSGMYFFKMKAGDYTKTIKAMMIK